MSKTHVKLCREAMGDGVVDPWNQERFEAAHPPELLLALWECYESAESATKNDYHWSSRYGIKKAVGRIEELTK